MKIAIINYELGNIQSVQNAIERIGYDSVITDNENIIRTADRVILPGVGSAGFAMQKIKEKGLDKVIPTLTQPVLGICLGMQLMCSKLEEDNTNGLSIFPLSVRKFQGDKVPHMGWNTAKKEADSLYTYFVHSYYVESSKFDLFQTEYEKTFASGIRRNNFTGLQFHPEKSGETGEKLIKQFIEQEL